ncbi:MAG: hypothetical protein CMF62_00610 [Magnetococcales bacterium]|nr:hypothetical protein [Magnetococcales bacterium]|tara:strand:- start:16326 stop:16637 length:312 start_codon:yes stop_codon:yes gene_type:complete
MFVYVYNKKINVNQNTTIKEIKDSLGIDITFWLRLTRDCNKYLKEELTIKDYNIRNTDKLIVVFEALKIDKKINYDLDLSQNKPCQKLPLVKDQTRQHIKIFV